MAASPPDRYARMWTQHQGSKMRARRVDSAVYVECMKSHAKRNGARFIRYVRGGACGVPSRREGSPEMHQAGLVHTSATTLGVHDVEIEDEDALPVFFDGERFRADEEDIEVVVRVHDGNRIGDAEVDLLSSSLPSSTSSSSASSGLEVMSSDEEYFGGATSRNRNARIQASSNTTDSSENSHVSDPDLCNS
ncbi:unnamed protein product [Amoebophrya sp. A25]|nr:unnamed protein product [Amoebophrya sp. A25]|eukprot:GSA25T00005735001.1